MLTQLRFQVGATGRWSGNLEREDGTRVGLANITNGSLWLRDAASGTYLRGSSVSPQDIFQSGAGQNDFQFADATIDGEDVTTIGWDVQLADVALVNSALPREEHVATLIINHTASGLAKRIRQDIRLRCVDAPGLCTFEDVSEALGTEEETSRVLIEDAIEAVGAFFERLRKRRLRKSTTALPSTQVFSPYPGQRILQLDRYPIDSVVSIKEATDGNFASGTTLDASSYYVDAERGQVELRDMDFQGGPGSVQVVYAGGLFRDTGAVDPDLRFMSARQVGFWWKTRDKLGIASVSVPGQSVTIFSQKALLPEVIEVFNSYRRPRHW